MAEEPPQPVSDPAPGGNPAFERGALHQPSAIDQPLPAARADLQISPQLYLGHTVYVAKDPINLSYYRLQPAEHYVMTRLDGWSTARQLAELVNARFPEQTT